MPTDTALRVECGYPIEPVQNGAARRCMTRLADHSGLDHEYVSLMVPCLFCSAAISWSADEWRDSMGGTDHDPDPRYI